MRATIRVALAVLGVCALLGALVVLTGCEPGALRMHAQAHALTVGTLSVGGAVVDEARAADLDRVQAEHPPGDERNAALDEAHGRWLPVGHALDAARQAAIAWAEGIRAAHEGEWEDERILGTLLPIGARVVLLYDEIVGLVRSLGAEMPGLPVMVRDLAATLGGGR